MPQTRAEARRRKARPANEGAAAAVWVDRAWRFVARPEFLGTLLAVAGLVLLLAPTSGVPETPSRGWWVAAFRSADAARAAATLVSAGSVVGLGMLVARVLTHRGAARRAVLWPTIALGLMGTGVSFGTLSWLSAQSDLPTSKLSVPPGATIESFPAIASGRSFKVMLPQRIFVESVDPEGSKAVIELRKAGEEEGVRNDVYVGDPLPLHDLRIALVGVEIDPRVRSAILYEPDGIEVRAAKGEKVRFKPDGPEFEVRQIATDYLGAMGPGVQLADPEGQTFWVFERDSKLPSAMTEVRLKRLETAPVAVFALASTPVEGALAAAGFIFVLGLALFLLVSDRTGASLNELGPVREQA